VYFSLFFIVLFTLPSWRLLFPNKSLQAYFLPEIDVVYQNCITKNTLQSSEDERGKHHAGAGASQVGNTYESLFYIVGTLT